MSTNKTVSSLKRAQINLDKKRKQLIKIKKQHQKLAGEFIDLWVTTRRLEKQLNIKKP